MSFFQRKSTYTDPEGRVVKKGIPKFIPVLILAVVVLFWNQIWPFALTKREREKEEQRERGREGER